MEANAASEDPVKSQASAAPGESKPPTVHKRKPFPLHLKDEILPPLYAAWPRRVGFQSVEFQVSPRRRTVRVIGTQADIKKATRQYKDLLQEAEAKDKVAAAQYREDGAVKVCDFFYNSVASISCELENREVVASYSWNRANPSEPYSVPGRLRRYNKAKIDAQMGLVKISYLPSEEKEQEEDKEKNKEQEEASMEEPRLMDVSRMACSACRPEFSFDAYDVVTNRNNLRKIFRWACGNKSRWRINIEKVSSTTVTMSSFYLKDSYISKRNQAIADKFEAECSEYTHETYRALVQFKMAGTRFLVQCEVDCAMPDQTSTPTFNPGINTEQIRTSEGSGLRYKLTSEILAPVFVELKTCNQAKLARRHDKIEYILDTWFQSYVAGVETLVIGTKNESHDGFNVLEIPLDSFLEQSPALTTTESATASTSSPTASPNTSTSVSAALSAASSSTQPPTTESPTESPSTPPISVDALEKQKKNALRKTMDVVRWIKEQMVRQPVGAKFYLLSEPTEGGWPKLYARPLSCYPGVASAIEELDEDKAWEIVRAVEADPRAVLRSLMRTDPARYLPLLTQTQPENSPN